MRRAMRTGSARSARSDFPERRLGIRRGRRSRCRPRPWFPPSYNGIASIRIPFHVHEIDAIRQDNTKWNYLNDGTLLIVAGVGVIVLNVVNGLYTNESAGSWVKTSGWITAGAFIIGGILMRRARYSDYKLGKKYTLHYLNMHIDNPEKNNPSVKPTEPAK